MLRRARSVHQQAKFHKNRARYHKRKLHWLMNEFERFQRDLEAMGITVILEPPTDNNSPIPTGGTSDHNRRSADP